MALLLLILQIIGSIPSIIAVVKEIFSLLKLKSPAVKAEVTRAVSVAMTEAKAQKKSGEFDKNLFLNRMQHILEQLKHS